MELSHFKQRGRGGVISISKKIGSGEASKFIMTKYFVD